MKNSTTLTKGVLIVPLLSLWSGRKHVQPEELGVELPPGVVTPGSKRIYPHEGIKVFETIKSRFMTAIEKVSVKYGRGVYCLSEEKLDDLVQEAKNLEAEWIAARDDLEVNYGQRLEDWLPTVEKKWRDLIRAAAIPAHEAVSKYAFRYSLLQIQAPEGHDAANEGMVTGLMGQTWTELSQIAHKAQEQMAGKAKVTQKGKSPLRRIVEKAWAVAFIDPRVKYLARHIEQQLDGLPKTGPIEGSDLDNLRVLLHTLSDPQRAVKIAEDFGGVSKKAAVSEEEKDDDSVETPDMDLVLADAEEEEQDGGGVAPSQVDDVVRRYF